MRRIALGIIGVLLVAGGIALWLANIDVGWSNFSSGVLIKTGAVTLLFCLAYHQVVRLFEVVPPWMIGAGLFGLGAIIAIPRPQTVFVVLGLFAAILVLHFAGVVLKPFAGKKGSTKGKRRANLSSQISDIKSDIPNLKSDIPNPKS